MPRNHRRPKPRTSPYYPSQHHTGRSTFGDDRAMFGPPR